MFLLSSAILKKRRRQGDPITLEDFLQQDATDKGLDGRPHGQQVARLLESADAVIVNDGPVAEFLEEVHRFGSRVLHPSTELDEIDDG